MATGAYIGVGGVAKKITGGYVGVGGVAKKIVKGYVGVGGVAQLFWEAGGGPVILEVEKITSDTYAGETSYTGEQFILLDIYPKTNGTVNVTYGGLTKTITDTSGVEAPNARQVFFGTFNGVSDSVTTPASGVLTIEGDYRLITTGTYKINTKSMFSDYCGCITDVIDWGNFTEEIPNSMFYDCTNLTLTSLPSSIKKIGYAAFSGCTSLALTSLPSGLTSIDYNAFSGCTSLALTSLPSSITSIGSGAFSGCTSLALTSLPSGLTGIEAYTFEGCTNINITEFPEGLVSIGNYAFHMDTTSLSTIAMSRCTIKFPTTLKSIGDEAFKYDAYSGDYFYWTYVETAIFAGTTPPTLGDDAFGNNGTIGNASPIGMTFVVPKGCSGTYQAAEGWSQYPTTMITEAS